LSKSLAHSEITSIFDENTLFDLKCLLVEHAGSNLRNRMAHGLPSSASEQDCLSRPTVEDDCLVRRFVRRR
ncbi:MAG: DUF4209 domain-containing protein, partial [Moorea sp. SIO2I5]|nr:DUF4209 domain-containing protein [Moorena sp. SIO2I5]